MNFDFMEISICLDEIYKEKLVTGLEYKCDWERTNSIYMNFNGKSIGRDKFEEDVVKVAEMQKGELEGYNKHFSFVVENTGIFHKFIFESVENNKFMFFEKRHTTDDTKRVLIKVYSRFDKSVLVDTIDIIARKLADLL